MGLKLNLPTLANSLLRSRKIVTYIIAMAKTRRGGSRGRRTRRRMPWAGWGRIAPQGHARTVMLRDCGKGCFLGPKKSFPICAKGTCTVNDKGLYAAYVRARQWGKKRSSYKGKARPRHTRRVYTRVANKARRMLKARGKLRGGKSRRRSSKRRRRSSKRRRRSSKRRRR